MNPELDPIQPYELNNFKSLMTEYKGLLTFEQVASWDQRASAEVSIIVSAMQQVDSKRADISRKVTQVQQERAEENFIARLFSGQKAEKALEKISVQLSEYKISLEGLASQLQEAIDFTPNSPEEQGTLLKELKARKKELQVKKREVAAEMKAIRTGATSQSAKAGMFMGGLVYDRKLAASQRRGIRYEKEAALRPHENATAAIERQILQVDRDILWVEKFT